MATVSSHLVYLAEREVASMLPPVGEQIDLVAEAYESIASGTAQVPATPLVEPRGGAFLHAMPSYLQNRDLTALKWIGGYGENPSRGLPYLTGLIVLNDSETGLPTAVMDCASITAARTAAASGLCIREFAREGWSSAAIIGYGIQAVAHEAVLRHFNPELDLRVCSRPPIPEGLAERARLTSSAREAIDGADIVITGIPLDARLDPQVTTDWLSPEVLVLPIDYDASISASISDAAELFFVDEMAGYELKRASGRFQQWRSPDSSVGEAIAAGRTATRGPVLCCNLGVGALDAVFAEVVMRRAGADGRGLRLPR